MTSVFEKFSDIDTSKVSKSAKVGNTITINVDTNMLKSGKVFKTFRFPPGLSYKYHTLGVMVLTMNIAQLSFTV
jgi:hypothetical protein